MRPRAVLGALAASCLASACLVVRPDRADAPSLARLAPPPGTSARSVALLAEQGPRGAPRGRNPPVDFLHTKGLEAGDTAPLLDALRASGWFSAVALEQESATRSGLWLEARYGVREAMDTDLFLLGYLTMTLFPVRSEVELTLELTVADESGPLGSVARAERVIVWGNWLLLPFGLLGQPLAQVRRVRVELLEAALAEARLRGWL